MSEKLVYGGGLLLLAILMALVLLTTQKETVEPKPATVVPQAEQTLRTKANCDAGKSLTGFRKAKHEQAYC